MSAARRFLLAVDIPTHVRGLVHVAELLHDSGRYEPVLVFKSTFVRDHCLRNHPATARFRHELWTVTEFRPLGSVDAPHRRAAAGPPAEQAASSDPGGCGGAAALPQTEPHIYMAGPLWKAPKATYKFLRRHAPWLPSPTSIVLAGLRAGDLAHRAVGFARRAAYHVAGVALRAAASVDWSAPSLRPQRQRERLLALAASLWNTPPGARPRWQIVAALGLRTTEAIREQRTFLQAFEALVARVRPALLLLPEENMFYGHLLMVHVTQRRGIATCIIPFTIANTLEWAEAFWHEPSFHANRRGNRRYAQAFPHWTLRHRGRTLLLPPAHILVSEHLGVAPDEPWLINSGPADALAAENGFMEDYYRRAGVRPDKLRRVGALSDDQLYGLIQRRDPARADLAAELGVPQARRLVLLGLPPDQFPGGRRPGCEYTRYEDLIRAMVQDALDAALPGDVVMLNLHPRIDEERVAFCEAMGARIVRAPIEHLVPLVDLYVAVASATIRLAMSCGIPVVNYDAYVYAYDDYVGLPGVLQMQTRAEYAGTLRSLLRDEQAYRRVREAQRATAADMCSVDGRAGERMLALFEGLLARS